MGLRTKLLATGLTACLVGIASLGEAGYAPGCSVRLDLGIGPVHEARAVALQPDARIVVAGYADLGLGAGRDFVIARFHEDLSLDTSFNGTGYVIADFFGKDDEAYSVVIQTDGKILAGGYAIDASGTKTLLALARYLPDGTLDPGFGALTQDIPVSTAEGLRALALQPDGSIVGVGYQSTAAQELVVVRLLKDGTWDTSFDTDGILTPSIGDASIGTGVVIAANGDIVVSGTAIFAGNADFLALSLRPDATYNTSFGGGWVSTDLGAADYANGGLAVDPNNNVIVVGDSNFDIALVRYRANGALDGAFGAGGIKFFNAGGNDSGQAVAINSLGIAVAGYAGPGVDFSLTRFLPADGVNDLSVNTAISGLQSQAKAIAIRLDGKYLLAGYSQVGSDNQLTLALFNSDGTQDCSTLTLHPEAEVTVAFDPVGSCVSNSDCVNDQVTNPLVGAPEPHDDTTSYVVSPSPIQSELYKLKDGVLPPGKVVTEIEVVGQLTWGGSGTMPSVNLLYQREGIDASPVRGATISVPNGSFQPFSQRWSGLNWESNDVDTLGIGLEHIAGNDIWMTQIYVTLTLGEPQVRPVDTFTASASGDGASGQVALNWLTPSYGIYDRTVIRRGSAGCPTSPAAGTGVVIKYDGLGGVGSYVDMPPHGTYYYSAFVVDADGHASKEACLVATTFDRTIEPREWVYSTSDPMPALATPGFRTLPGIAYMVTNDGRVHAMMGGDAGTGGGSWPSGWKPFHLPTIAPNRPPVAPLPSGQWAALLGGEDGRVYAIDSTSGALLWRSARLGPMISSSPAAMFTLFGASQNLIFIGTRNSGGPNQLYALDPNDGTVVWTFDPGTGANSMGMMTNGPTFDYNTEHLYFSSYRGGSGNTLWCLDLSGGSPAQCGLWPDYGVPVSLSDIDVSPVLFAGYLVVSDTTAGDLYVVNPTDGSSLLIGSAGTGGAIGFVFPRFGTTDVIVSSSTDVQSVDVTPPGTSHWNWGVPSPSTPLQAPYTDDIYVGRTDGKLHQLSTLAPGGPGTTLCIGDCLNTVVGSPTYDVVKDMIYVGTIDGEIYAVKTPY